jgi:hypothetical protein
MRYFLRVDGPVGVGPALGAVVFVDTGATLTLDDSDPVEERVAADIARASSGWVEVDEAGAAMASDVDRSQPPERRHFFAEAEVTQVENPETESPEALADEGTV